MNRQITVIKNGKTKNSQSGNTISEILNSIYMQNNIKDEDIQDGVVDSNSTTWIEAKTKTSNIRIEIV